MPQISFPHIKLPAIPNSITALSSPVAEALRPRADAFKVKLASGEYWTYSDFARHTVNGRQIAPVEGDERRESVQVDAEWYMKQGPGQKFDVSSSGALQHLMSRQDLSPGTYNFEDLYSRSDRVESLSHYRTDRLGGDWIYRSAVWGGSSFLLKGGTVHVAQNGTIRLVGMEVRPFDDNFDFEASDKPWPLNEFNDAQRRHFDPNGEGDTFLIEFVGNGWVIPELNAQNLSQTGAYGPNRDTYWRGRYCFAAGVLVDLPDGQSKPIETVAVGDMIAAFDGNTALGRGALQSARVTRLFVTEDQELINFGGVLVTPGHMFLTDTGEFREIGQILACDLRIVTSGGAVVRARDRIEAAAGIEGDWTPERVPGLHTVYNFEVEGLHTYVAGGWRVHNESVFAPDTEAGQQADNLLDRFARLSFADDPLEYIAFGSALRALGSTAVDSIAGDTPFDANHIGGRFATNAVGALGGYAARTLVLELADELGLPDELQGPLGIFAETAGTAAAQIQAIRYILSISQEGSALAEAAQNSLDALDPELFLQNAAVSALSSLAASKIADLIGIDQELAPFISAPAGAALTQIGQNLLNDVSWSQGLAKPSFNALGAIAADYLANEIAEWDSDGEIIGSSLGSGLGSIIGQTLIPIPILGGFVGALARNAFLFTLRADGLVTATHTATGDIDVLENIEWVRFDDEASPVALGTLLAIEGTEGDDNLTGGFGDDVILGLGGDDILYGAAGNDLLDGGAGEDQASFAGKLGEVRLERQENGDVVATDLVGSDGVDTLRNIEAVYFDGDGNWRTLIELVGGHGTEGDDAWVQGTGNNDRLFGLTGDDTLVGRAGDDFLYGGEGYDQANYAGDIADFVFTRQADGGVTIADKSGAEGVDTVFDMEAVYFEASQTWESLNNLVADYGTEGDDAWVQGTGNNDRLFGLTGDDTLVGRAGDDFLYGGEGYDQANYAGDIADFVFTRQADGAVTIADTTGAEGVDTAFDMEAVYFESSQTWAPLNTLVADYGTEGDDAWVQGTMGSDRIYGLAGDDSLVGSEGDDFLYGGDGYDQANYFGASTDFSFTRNIDGTVTVTDLVGGEGSDVLDGVEAVYFDRDGVWSTVEALLGGGTTSSAATGSMSHDGTSRGVFEAVDKQAPSSAGGQRVLNPYQVTTPSVLDDGRFQVAYDLPIDWLEIRSGILQDHAFH